jgi:hypothetical protein
MNNVTQKQKGSGIRPSGPDEETRAFVFMRKARKEEGL